MLKILGKIDNCFTWIEHKILIIIPLLLTLLTITSVFNRYFYFLIKTISLNEEIAIYLFILLVYWGASNIAKDDKHLTVDLLKKKLKGKSRIYSEIIIYSISLLVSLCGVYFGIKMSLITNARTSVLRIPVSIILQSTMVVGFIGISLRYFIKMISILKSLKEDKKREIDGE